MEWNKLPCGEWTELHVSSWLKSVGIKDKYIQRLFDEEVTGPALMSLQRDFLLNTIEMKGGQIELLRLGLDELSKSRENHSKKESGSQKVTTNDPDDCVVSSVGCKAEVSNKEHESDVSTQSEDTRGQTLILCDYRKFDEHDKNFKYVKHKVLPPETGIENMIVPCHEYKSLEKAHKLKPNKLRAKIASEVIRFACGCMNMRSNGTIHFGVMDKATGNFRHGEVIGVPIDNQEEFVDALDYIERCFKGPGHQLDARKCIRNPKFIEVIDKGGRGGNWVIEFDVVSNASVVKGKLYTVTIPKFSEKDNKVIYEKKAAYHRVGASTPRIAEEIYVHFIQGLKEKDQQREERESLIDQAHVERATEDLGRKLAILLTCGKKYMDDTLSYIIVTNKFEEEHLSAIGFLLRMNIFCVFDFDPDSFKTGLCGQYRKHHAANLHFLHDYANDAGLTTADFQGKLQLIDRTSWIFCNGRNDFLGGEEPCHEKTWIRTKKKLLKRTVGLICNDLLPKGSFVVLFLLMSPVEQPLVDSFHEFFAEMSGHEDLAIISESKDNYKKWSSLAQVSCEMDVLNGISVVGMPMNHVNDTIQSIQLSSKPNNRCLPVFNKGICFLKPIDEDKMLSLEVVSANQCDETNLDVMGPDQVSNIEQYFYQGGKIGWMHMWLAERGNCDEIIQRDAYKETTVLVENIFHGDKAKRFVQSVNIFHQAGSGGSTVAHQIIWNWRKKMRSAVVKQSYSIQTVCEHAVLLREYEEKDQINCLPVLLLLDNCNAEYVDDLRRELDNAIVTMKINPSVLCFILLICKRCHDPQKMIRAMPNQAVAVTHNLSDQEKTLFKKKRQALKFEPESILSFVLMCEGFQKSYITGVVKDLLGDIDHSSLTTRLIRIVALFNCHVENSYLSVSHCEASLGLGIQMDRFRYQTFVNSLSEQAKLVFIHLNDNKTHISSIKINSLVAEEILNQLSAQWPKSSIAKDLLLDKVLMNHRFGKEEFLKFLRDLLIKRNKVSRGDPKDTSFSPLIEHVSKEKNGLNNAKELLEIAYTCFGKDAFIAQQLARLLYTNKEFSEAQRWAEEAKSCLPYDTFILDTEGQVYKRWFYDQYDALDPTERRPEKVSEIISTALKGLSAFRASEKAPKSESVSLNSSYFGEVDVGCRLLQLISSMDIFSAKDGNSELMKYLLTDYIPDAIRKLWRDFHGQLKGMQKSLHNALECISEDLSYYNTEFSEEVEQLDTREADQIKSPRKWLKRKGSVYAAFFCNVEDFPDCSVSDYKDAGKVDHLFIQQMKIYKLGGGNVTTILSLLSNQKTQDVGKNLEDLICLYPEKPQRTDLDHTDLVNYSFTQIALACTLPGSAKVASLAELQNLSMRFYRDGSKLTSAFFLLSILFCPEDLKENDTGSVKSHKVLMYAVDNLQRQCLLKTKPRKSRIVTHFFLGKARGLNKIVHRSVIEKHTKGNLSERRLKWLSGEIWANPDVMKLLKRVEGWTENGDMFVPGPAKGRKIKVIPMKRASLPNANENVTFYLGFSFDGLVAFDIKIMNIDS